MADKAPDLGELAVKMVYSSPQVVLRGWWIYMVDPCLWDKVPRNVRRILNQSWKEGCRSAQDVVEAGPEAAWTWENVGETSVREFANWMQRPGIRDGLSIANRGKWWDYVDLTRVT